MTKYAVYFVRHYAMTVEADNPEEAVGKALEEFSEDEANAASDWETSEFVDRLD